MSDAMSSRASPTPASPHPARIVCLQTEPCFGAREDNLADAERRLRGVEADLVVLPELFATGYSFRDRAEAISFAEPAHGGPTVERLCRWSTETGGIVVGGFPEVDGERLFNTCVAVAAGAVLAVYRKVHLFGFEGEIYDPGDTPFGVVTHGGLRVGLMICFDWVFPEAARCLALAGADVLAHPSNLVLPFCRQAMPIRALENGVFAVTANRVGTEHRPPRPELPFTGHSQILSPLGEVLAEAGGGEPELLSVDVDLTRARDKSLASGNDRMAERRPGFYGPLLAETER